ncbi:Twf1 protein [Saccharomycopsis crataegensis]|uniref:Twf1 protein n=1 Tax=Saccharomycopsis crataegensis TaxID=43959 RepID=A0AAV5QLY5_9ASCO|nr:Twf1 protein [Saccharomycopsis crataegensis]
MSNQSGITASQDLVDSFSQFIKDTSGNRALLLKIANETVVVDQQIAGTSSFANDWDLVASQLTTTDPRYIFYKNDTAHPRYLIFISYVPDYAQIKSKMLYASTKSTLLRQLGNQDIIKKHYLVNDLDEISYKGYQEHERSEKLEAPLTESERSLKQINESEVNTLFFNQTGSSSTSIKRSLVRMDHSSNMKGTMIDDDVFEKLLGNGTFVPGTLVSTKINSNETIYFVDSYSGITPPEVSQAIGKVDGPQFSFYKNTLNNIFFIYTCPSGSKIRDRMLYASTKQGFLANLKEKGIVINKIVEIGDPIEIEVSDLEESHAAATGSSSGANQQGGVDTSSIASVVSSQLKLNKPKGPRRR